MGRRWISSLDECHSEMMDVPWLAFLIMASSDGLFWKKSSIDNFSEAAALEEYVCCFSVFVFVDEVGEGLWVEFS